MALTALNLGLATSQPSFLGTEIKYNTLWTSPTAHVDIALIVGTRAWHGNNTDKGTDAHFSYNTTGNQKVRTNTAIMVSGLLNVTVIGNSLLTEIDNYSACPAGNVITSVSSGWASGNIQPYTDVLVNPCIGH